MGRPAIAACIASAFVFCTPVVAAPRTAAEDTHCLAVGMTLSRLAAAESQVVRMLKSSSDPGRIAELEAHAADMTQTGATLRSRYARANPPTREDLDVLDRTPIDNLLDQAADCQD